MVGRIIQREFPEVAFHAIDDPERALAQIESGTLFSDSPKIILIDINMPKVNGFEILTALHANGAFTSTPKVIFSSSTQQRDIEEAYAFKCNSYIEKPQSYPKLKETLTKTLEYWLTYNLN